MSYEEDLKEYLAGKDDKVDSVLGHFGEKVGNAYPDEVFKAAAEDIIEREHPLAKIVKAASKGIVSVAAEMIHDLDINGDVPVLDPDVEKSWENYEAMALEMLK